jgi:hypothetical protein
MADFASQITDLQADFQRIADRAAWVRAFFTVSAKGVGLFSFGRAGGDGRVEPILIECGNPVELELHALTNRAGALAAELCGSKHYQWKAVSPKAVQYKCREPEAFWLVFLLHTPPVCGYCKSTGPDGRTTFALPQVGVDEVSVWIDNYAQVCLGALAILKAASTAAAKPLLAHATAVECDRAVQHGQPPAPAGLAAGTGRMGTQIDKQTPKHTQSGANPDGPFDADGFRYRGIEVRFGRAGKQRGLVLALWDQKKRRPRPARPIEDVITEVYGEDNDTSNRAFIQLCSDTQKKLDAAGVALKIQNLQGKVRLTERPR